MKVKIAYTVELDDVPAECMKIIEQKQTELSDALSILMDIRKENIVASLDKIKQCREHLLTVDMCLTDCTSILAGYIQASYGSADHNEVEAIKEKAEQLLESVKGG